MILLFLKRVFSTNEKFLLFFDMFFDVFNDFSISSKFSTSSIALKCFEKQFFFFFELNVISLLLSFVVKKIAYYFAIFF